uniref:Uncharacterized protein n=1 Tax=viral metagenome TaxID=1070528 RepID=A0A6H1ZXG0_9ZZZZ
MVDALLKPIQKARIHNIAVSSGADFLATDLSPSKPPTLFRVMISVDTATRFSAYLIFNGADVVISHFNQGIDLVANCLYIFDILVGSLDTINFIVDDDVTINDFTVQEITAGTQ